MSKKSYKNLRNRLYREIKQRLLAEHRYNKPLKFTTYTKPVHEIKLREIVYHDEDEYFVKQMMANKIAEALMDGGYIDFHSKHLHDEFGYKDGMPREYVATLLVVQPISEVKTNE